MAETLAGSTGVPSPEEQILVDLRAGQYQAAGAAILQDFAAGKPPSVVAIVHPGILFPLCEVLWQGVGDTPLQTTQGYKAELFGAYLDAACSGDPAAISALPKFATTPGELAVAVSLALDFKDRVTQWRDGRQYVRFTGSYSPLHIGHRAAMHSTLEMVGSRSSGVIQVVADHPFKHDLPPYKDRFDPGEEKLYHSDLLDPTRVTMLDMPLGLGLARVGCEQNRLLADITGDDEMRWHVGSDKLLRDVEDVRAGRLLDQAGVRLRHVHQYVSRRDTESPEEVAAVIAYAQEQFNAIITQIPDSPTELVLGAAATKIRLFRNEDNHYKADEMEFSDLTTLNRERYRQSYSHPPRL